MANRYPGANYRILGPQTQARMKAHDIICLHTMVGTLYGTDTMFKSQGFGGNESHFGTGYDGECYQWQDLDFTADANLNGNYRVISIENADMGTGFPKWDTNKDDVPYFTDAQVNRLADLIAWLCTQYDIPCELIPDTKPGRRGVAYHRQGCDGNYPDGRIIGGELWSSSTGKVCPGNRRIAQIPVIIDRAKQILRGNKPSPTPKPRPVEDEDFMYIACQPDPKKPPMYAILSGPMFVGVGTPGELKSVLGNIEKGAMVQWVELSTWLDFDGRSHALCANPRPVSLHTLQTGGDTTNVVVNP